MKTALLAVFLTALSVSPSAAADLKLDIRDGRVTLDAQDVTIRQILAEWARVGKTRIVNLERVASGTVSLQLSGVPEPQALEIILRPVAGYMAAPRPTPLPGTSAYDRILILAVSTVTNPPRAGTTPFPTGPAAPTQFRLTPAPLQAPGVIPQPAADDADDQDDAAAAAAAAGLVAVPAPNPNANLPGIMTSPSGSPTPLMAPSGPAQPQSTAPPTPAVPVTGSPFSVPAGTATPGLVSPQPPAPTRTNPAARPPQSDR